MLTEIVVSRVGSTVFVVLPRLCLRTLGRLLGLTDSCSPECPESFQNVFFNRESIIWWCITNHPATQKRESELLRLEGVHVGGKRRRIGGWGHELQEWKQGVQRMVRDTEITRMAN